MQQVPGGGFGRCAIGVSCSRLATSVRPPETIVIGGCNRAGLMVVPRFRNEDLSIVLYTPRGYHVRMNGYDDNKADLRKRLSRVEGQVRGIARMVDEDKYCIDILTQVSAATRALETMALSLLSDHLSHCVAEASAEGGEVAAEKVREAN